MLDDKKQQELKISNHVFRAKSVPSNVLIPLFDEIMKAQQEKREKVKRESVAITKMNERPFEFYIRDLNKTPKSENNANEFRETFHARPIPE